MGTPIVWHRRLMIVEAVLFAAVLLCAVLLAFEMPLRQHAAMKHAQIGEFAMRGSTPHAGDEVDGSDAAPLQLAKSDRDGVVQAGTILGITQKVFPNLFP